jgi:hypothetical protein
VGLNRHRHMFKVSVMRIASTVVIVALAIGASTIAHGQVLSGRAPPAGAQAANGRPAAPPIGAGDRTLMPSTQPATALPAMAPPESSLKNLAGGGYADPNFVPPMDRSKKSTRHRAVGSPRVRISHRFERYGGLSFAYRYCCCGYGPYY